MTTVAKNEAAAVEPAVARAPAARAEDLTGLGRPSSWRRILARLGRNGSLVLVDVSAVLLAWSVAYLGWALPVRGQPAKIYFDLLVLLPLFPLAYARAGLYPGFGVGAVETLRRLTLASAFIYLVLAAFSFALRVPHHYARISFAIALVATLVLVPLVRFVFLSFAHRWSWWGEPAVVVGDARGAERLIRVLDNAVSLGYQPVATVPLRSAEDRLPSLRRIEDLSRHGVHIAFLTDDTQLDVRGETFRQLSQCFRHVIVVRNPGELPVEGAVIRNLGGVLGVEFVNQLLRPYNRAVKRIFDVLLSSFGLVLAAPVLAVSALLIKLVSRGPALFAHRREGRGGAMIRVYKFRTMYVDAEERLEACLATDPTARRQWQERFKLRDDPRVIPVIGRVLRRFSIDELPQLWNVLKGEMSLVGPRPFPDYHLEQFPRDFLELRRQVRPGITGLWQVMIRSEGGIAEQQTYDTYYIRNWSLWMDLYILSRTLQAAAGGRGAY